MDKAAPDNIQYHIITETHAACVRLGFTEEAAMLKTNYIDRYTGGRYIKLVRPEDRAQIFKLASRIRKREPGFAFGPTPNRSVPPRPFGPPGNQSVIISGPPGGDVMGDQQLNFNVGEFMEAPATSEIEGDMADLQQYHSWLASEWSQGSYVGPQEFVDITNAVRKAKRDAEASKQKANPS